MDLLWQQWVLIGLFSVSVVANILLVGKPRVPLTNTNALVSVVMGVGLVLLVLSMSGDLSG